MFNYHLFINPVPIISKILQNEKPDTVLFNAKYNFWGQSFIIENKLLKKYIFLNFCFHFLEED